MTSETFASQMKFIYCSKKIMNFIVNYFHDIFRKCPEVGIQIAHPIPCWGAATSRLTVQGPVYKKVRTKHQFLISHFISCMYVQIFSILDLFLYQIIKTYFHDVIFFIVTLLLSRFVIAFCYYRVLLLSCFVIITFYYYRVL